MVKKNDLAGRLDLGQSRRKTTATGPKPPAVEPSGTVRTKPVRVTSDLPPVQYRELVAFCDQLAVELGRAKVPQVEVHRALLHELIADEKLAQRVRRRIANQLAQ